MLVRRASVVNVASSSSLVSLFVYVICNLCSYVVRVRESVGQCVALVQVMNLVVSHAVSVTESSVFECVLLSRRGSQGFLCLRVCLRVSCCLGDEVKFLCVIDPCCQNNGVKHFSSYRSNGAVKPLCVSRVAKTVVSSLSLCLPGDGTALARHAEV